MSNFKLENVLQKTVLVEGEPRIKIRSELEQIVGVNDKLRIYWKKTKVLDLSDANDWSKTEEVVQESEQNFYDEDLEIILALPQMVPFKALLIAGVSKEVPSPRDWGSTPGV